MPAAMVLAAGLGTRLHPLTEGCAKPLVPIGDRPMLAHILARLRAGGLGRIVVNAHHRGADIETFARSYAEVTVSSETHLLGTAGGVARAATELGAGDVLVWNGDIFADVDVRALTAMHHADATLVVRPRAPREGSVGLDREGRIVRLRTTQVADEARGGDFLGIHVVGSSLRGSLPDRGCLVGDVYVPALRDGAELRVFLQDAPFFDVGTVKRYLDANFAWLGARHASHWIGEGADVASGVTLEQAVVGASARVVGGGALTRCVVWPGATAVAPLADAVVTRDRVVLRAPSIPSA